MVQAQVFGRKGRRNQGLARLLRCIKSPNFPAAWCERLQSSAEALQTPGGILRREVGPPPRLPVLQ
jgi:hypothetical protein